MEMIEVSKLVTFECPHCGYITKGTSGEKLQCPKCTPNFHGWISKIKNGGPYIYDASHNSLEDE